MNHRLTVFVSLERGLDYNSAGDTHTAAIDMRANTTPSLHPDGLPQMHPSFGRNDPTEARPWRKGSRSSAWCLLLLACPFPAYLGKAFSESYCSKRAELSCPTLPLGTKRFWMKWEKRIKKCFPTHSWIQGQSAYTKFSFHYDIFRMRQQFQNWKTVQKLYLIFIKMRMFRFGGQFHDIVLTGSWRVFSVVSWGIFLSHSQSPISHLGTNWLISIKFSMHVEESKMSMLL